MPQASESGSRKRRVTKRGRSMTVVNHDAATADRASLTSLNPITGDTVGRALVDGVPQVADAVAAARAAGFEWSALGVDERAAHLMRVRQSFADHADGIAEAVHDE